MSYAEVITGWRAERCGGTDIHAEQNKEEEGFTIGPGAAESS